MWSCLCRCLNTFPYLALPCTCRPWALFTWQCVPFPVSRLLPCTSRELPSVSSHYPSPLAPPPKAYRPSRANAVVVMFSVWCCRSGQHRGNARDSVPRSIQWLRGRPHSRGRVVRRVRPQPAAADLLPGAGEPSAEAARGNERDQRGGWRAAQGAAVVDHEPSRVGGWRRCVVAVGGEPCVGAGAWHCINGEWMTAGFVPRV